MFNSLMLEIAITRSQISKRDLAKKLGISEQGLYNKLNGISEFKASEIRALSDELSFLTRTRGNFFRKRAFIYHSFEQEVTVMESIKFNFDQIPEKEARVLGQTLLDACKKFYSDPKNLAAYEAWEAQQEAEHE